LLNPAWYQVSVLLTCSFSHFCGSKDILKQTKTRQLVYLPTAQHMYILICTSYTCEVCMCTSVAVHLYSSEISRCLVPTPRLTSEYSICSACVCAYTHTQRLTHTHQLPRKIERRTKDLGLCLISLPRSNSSLALMTNANRRSPDKPSFVPPFYICMQLC